VKRCCKQGFHYFRALSEDFALRRFQFLVNRPDEPSRPDAHLTTVPSVRLTCHTVRTPIRPSIIRPDDVQFRSDPPLCREGSIQLASIRTSQQHVWTPLGTRPVSNSFQVSIKERSSNRPDDVVSCRTRLFVRQESQFKYHRPDVYQSWFGCECN
jgi:hypothetical protein